MNNKIRNIFLGANLKIVNISKLDEYIIFCNTRENLKITNKTSHHHILPQAEYLPFKGYSNLRENPWNGVHLTHSEHYTAHSMLNEAIEHISIISAFKAMNNCDLKMGRLSEEDLIGKEEFAIVMEKSFDIQREWNKQISKDGIRTNKEVSSDNMIKTRRTKNSDGLDSYETMIIGIKNITDENGLNSLQRGGINSRQKMREDIDENGLNAFQRGGIKLRETLDKRAKKFNVYDINDKLIYESIMEKEVRKISQNLPFCTKDKRLGNNPSSSKRYINNNKEHLIGLYSVEYKKD